MTFKKTLYIVLVMVVAGVSALTGAMAGGAVVYQIAQKQSANPLTTDRRMSRPRTPRASSAAPGSRNCEQTQSPAA